MSGPPVFGFSNTVSRLGSFGWSATVAGTYMLARYGLGGVFQFNRPFRFSIFIVLFALTLLGGFRIILIYFIVVGTLLFFLEGLHRTKMLPIMVMLVAVCMSLLIPFAGKLPLSFQRALTVVPFLKLDSTAVLDAQGSKQWRENIWHDTWPKVPHYLLLGKGYALTTEDYEMMGAGQFANGAGSRSGQKQCGSGHGWRLPQRSAFHSHALCGIWGAISYIWIRAGGIICHLP